MLRAEEKALALPANMMIPLILFNLPLPDRGADAAGRGEDRARLRRALTRA
jgi:hypothetical protein